MAAEALQYGLDGPTETFNLEEVVDEAFETSEETGVPNVPATKTASALNRFKKATTKVININRMKRWGGLLELVAPKAKVPIVKTFNEYDMQVDG